MLLSSCGIFLDWLRLPSVQHAWAIIALLLGSALLVKIGWFFHQRGESSGKRFDRLLANLLLLIWIIAFLWDLLPSKIGWGNSLPLHVCDFIGLVAPFALVSDRRVLRNALYFCGLGVCSQAIITPAIQAGPLHFDFWLYWFDHGAIIAAAIYDLAVRRYRPTWWDWQQMVLISVGYLMAIVPIDVLMHFNYGYLGNTEDAQRSVVTVFGNWPARIPRLFLASWIVMAAMVLPWLRWRKSDEANDSAFAELATEMG
jgi:hypothetical integral membrane protein (TIGR02206 family)